MKHRISLLPTCLLVSVSAAIPIVRVDKVPSPPNIRVDIPVPPPVPRPVISPLRRSAKDLKPWTSTQYSRDESKTALGVRSGEPDGAGAIVARQGQYCAADQVGCGNGFCCGKGQECFVEDDKALCRAGNSITTAFLQTSTPTGRPSVVPSSSSSPSSASRTGIAVGTATGIFLLLAALGVLAFFLVRKRRCIVKKRTASSSQPSKHTFQDEAGTGGSHYSDRSKEKPRAGKVVVRAVENEKQPESPALPAPAVPFKDEDEKGRGLGKRHSQKRHKTALAGLDKIVAGRERLDQKKRHHRTKTPLAELPASPARAHQRKKTPLAELPATPIRKQASNTED